MYRRKCTAAFRTSSTRCTVSQAWIEWRSEEDAIKESLKKNLNAPRPSELKEEKSRIILGSFGNHFPNSSFHLIFLNAAGPADELERSPKFPR